jgi:hypothetical protein
MGTPREIKTAEFRVALTPSGVTRPVGAGHSVFVEAMAGAGRGIAYDAYIKSGSRITETAAEIWETADMILKVKEPIGDELDHIDHRGSSLTLFTYLHLAGIPGLAERLSKAGVNAIADETPEASTWNKRRSAFGWARNSTSERRGHRSWSSRQECFPTGYGDGCVCEPGEPESGKIAYIHVGQQPWQPHDRDRQRGQHRRCGSEQRSRDRCGICCRRPCAACRFESDDRIYAARFRRR